MAQSTVSLSLSPGDGYVTHMVVFTEGTDSNSFKKSGIKYVIITYTDNDNTVKEYFLTASELGPLKTNGITYVNISVVNGSPIQSKASINGKSTLESSTQSSSGIASPSSIYINRFNSSATGKTSFVVNINQSPDSGVTEVVAHYSLQDRYSTTTGAKTNVNTLYEKRFNYSSLTPDSNGHLHLLFDGSDDNIEENSEYEVSLKFYNGTSELLSAKTADSQIVIKVTDQCYKPLNVICDSTGSVSFNSSNNSSYLPVTGIMVQRKRTDGTYNSAENTYYKYNADKSFTLLSGSDLTADTTTGLPVGLGSGNRMENFNKEGTSSGGTKYSFSITAPTPNQLYTYRIIPLNSVSTLNNPNLNSGESNIGEPSDEFSVVNMATPSAVVIERPVTTNEGYERITDTTVLNQLQTAYPSVFTIPTIIYNYIGVVSTDLYFTQPTQNWVTNPYNATTNPTGPTEAFYVGNITVNAVKPALYTAIKYWFDNASPSDKVDIDSQDALYNKLSSILGITVGSNTNAATYNTLTYGVWMGYTTLAQKKSHTDVNGMESLANAIDAFYAVINLAKTCVDAITGQANEIVVNDTDPIDANLFTIVEDAVNKPKAVFAPAGSAVSVTLTPKLTLTHNGTQITETGPSSMIKFNPTSKISNSAINIDATAGDADITVNVKHMSFDHGHTLSDHNSLNEVYSVTLTNITSQVTQPTKYVVALHDSSPFAFYKPFSFKVSELGLTVPNGPRMKVQLSGSFKTYAGTGDDPANSAHIVSHYDYGSVTGSLLNIQNSGTADPLYGIGQSAPPTFTTLQYPNDGQSGGEITVLITALSATGTSGLNGATLSTYDFHIIKESQSFPTRQHSVAYAADPKTQTGRQVLEGYVSNRVGLLQSTTTTRDHKTQTGLTPGSYFVIAKTKCTVTGADSDYIVAPSPVLVYTNPSASSTQPIIVNDNGVLTVKGIKQPSNNGFGVSSFDEISKITLYLHTVSGGVTTKIPNLSIDIPYNNGTSYSSGVGDVGLDFTIINGVHGPSGQKFSAVLGSEYKASLILTSKRKGGTADLTPSSPTYGTVTEGAYLTSTESFTSNTTIARQTPVISNVALSNNNKRVTINYTPNGATIDSGVIVYSTGGKDSIYVIDSSYFTGVTGATNSIAVDFSGGNAATNWPTGETSIKACIAILTDTDNNYIFGTVSA